jgi:hypothetical protein
VSSIVLTTGLLLVGGAATTSADAASLRTWNKLAQCESGGRWHINTGNGYYGGLQFSDPTWDAFKGRKMAHRADKARKKAQIRTAEKVRRAQGWGAWPHCSQKLGLR